MLICCSSDRNLTLWGIITLTGPATLSLLIMFKWSGTFACYLPIFLLRTPCSSVYLHSSVWIRPHSDSDPVTHSNNYIPCGLCYLSATTWLLCFKFLSFPFLKMSLAVFQAFLQSPENRTEIWVILAPPIPEDSSRYIPGILSHLKDL